MITLNKNTKKAMYYIGCFNRCNDYSIYGIYKNPSNTKISIAKNLERNLFEEGWTDFRYLHGNSFNFVMGCKKDNTLRIETVGNTYIIDL